MKLSIGLLLLVTFSSVLGNSSGARTSRQNSGGTGTSATNNIYTSSNHTITIVSNKTITHSTNLNVDLKHLVVDRNTGRVFIGGRNRLFQLSPDLDIVATAITGPKNVSNECLFGKCTPNQARNPTDNVNKVLLIDYATSRLIACGSISQGYCNVVNLQNVSIIEKEIQEAVVANNEHASTVAFIAPGPPSPPVTNVMYVGVTYAGNSVYQSETPAVASRSLEGDRMFQIASTGVTTGTRISINPNARESYLVNYVYGFSSERFSYFLTTQMKSNDPGTQKEYISKLVRVCQEDSHYYSYTEIPIDCIGETKYNLVGAAYLGKPGTDLAENLGITVQDDVLYAVFSEGKDSAPTNRSALCVYSLKSIRRKFMQNIKSCFNGHGLRGLDFISQNMRCTMTKLQTISEDFCGLDVNYPLGGEQPIAAVPVCLFNSQLTAVAATRTSGYTVVFAGTSDGHLKKVVVESATSAIEYADLAINHGSPVNSDMHFDTQELNLYVMTKKHVFKVKVHDCTVYSSCSECLGAKDPYCGWCNLENKCSLRSSCDVAAEDPMDPLIWLTYKTGKCTTITSVIPHQLQRTTARTLELTIDHLPPINEPLVCAFTTLDKPTIHTNATRKRNGVNCTTPRTDLLPQIAQGKHHFTSKLSVRTVNGPDLVTTNFTFFDCSTHLSCTRCVSSQFPCDWCVEAHRCTHDTAENCRNDILVTGVSRIGPSYRSGPGFCPTINATGDVSEILVAHGSKKSIKVKVHIIGQFIVQTRFVCQFNIEGRVTSVNAQLLGDTIYCDAMEFVYTSKAPNLTVAFAVIWGGSKPLDNPDNIHIVIYRCRDMCDSCGTCLALPEKFNCGWCQSTSSCEVIEQCSKHDEKKNDWLNRVQTCPNPRINSFEPLTGPWEGGTNITIRGVNLGKNFSDIYSGVKVAGITCMPFANLYVDTKEIVCTVDSPGVQKYRHGRIVVQIADYRAESTTDYQFVDPQIEDFQPRFGPMSGGTKIRISGRHLNAGSRFKAFVGDQQCHILSVDESEALCKTTAARNGLSGIFTMHFDNGVRDLEMEQFRYVADPTVEYATSGPNNVKAPKGIPAGGIKITVVGSQFEAIQKPVMNVYLQNMEYSNVCEVVSDTEMVCDSPKIDSEKLELDAENPMMLDYGFKMDDVTGVANLTNKDHQSFQLFPNPVYYQFEEELKYFKGDYLTINGRNLDRACKESDVIVMIGEQTCNITSLSRTQLTCRPPTLEAIDSNEAPEVVVKVGSGPEALNYKIGILSYASPALMQGLSRNALFGASAGIVILLLVFIALLIAYRKKTSESNRVLKNMQEQMDILELQVAAECKEAFAELQTEMGDLTGDLTSIGIPFLDYRTYAMKILFPNNEDHIVLQWERPELLEKDKGLRLFGQLIMNKTFLLLFIRTLESNRYFSMRERVNVASLIMVTLQSKLEYCTDILKTLLAELIEKCIDGKSHPKLLLRRTESVAEKMLSAWFTFLLYKFLRECAGEPLYMLFRAMKGQVDKGPVDAITHEARYSLSEEKLIRQLIDFKIMTVYASITQQPILLHTNSDFLPTNTENVPVRVLDCDTISQVKEKCLETIYRNTPWSQRPRRDDLDLEWRTGTTGRVILFDEDTTSKMDNEWKKLNTLHHYRVPDNACLSLVSRQSPIYSLSILSDKNDKSHKYETLNMSTKYPSSSPPFSRAGSPLNADGQENGLKWYHLVKHHDIDLQKEGERVNKMVSEIYLTRLLATKGTLQKFVDDLFETIFSTAHRGSALPLAIKYMFDFLDDQALLHGITDPEVVHTWKSNSLPLRFWVNLIKNPNFVFDIHKSNIVDSCLSVVAQTFMDSCSTSDHRLGKDSPSSKLLYAKDIPLYRGWVERYYSDIREMQAISDQDMNAMLAEESRIHLTEFNTNCALHELYTYAVKYNEQLTVTLEEDEFSQKQRLAYKLEQVHNIMSLE